MKEINISNSTIDFTLLLPYNNKDIPLIYSDKKSSLELSAFYELGIYNNHYSSSLFSRLFSVDGYTNKVNLIKSHELYLDLKNKNSKKSNIIFLWSGKCSKEERKLMQDSLSLNSDELYDLYTNYHNDNYNDNEKKYFLDRINDILRILAFRASIIDLQNKHKEKRKRNLLLILSIIYLISLGITTFILMAKLL